MIKYPTQSRSFLQKLIRDGQVRIGGKKITTPHFAVAEEAAVLCNFPASVRLSIQPVPTDLKILFEDSELIVVDKPPGVSVHPQANDPETPTLVHFLLAHVEDLSGIGGVLRPGIVHRLDKDTSGIIAVAKNDLAHRSLAKQWADRTVEKQYTALVSGTFHEKKGKIEAPILRSTKDRKKMIVSNARNAKKASTEFRVLREFFLKAEAKQRRMEFSLLLCKPKTGRTHQIRVHLASIGHPIIGDALYGYTKENRFFEKNFGLTRQFLHASQLIFRHPKTDKKMKISSPLTADLERVLNLLKQ